MQTPKQNTFLAFQRSSLGCWNIAFFIILFCFALPLSVSADQEEALFQKEQELERIETEYKEYKAELDAAFESRIGEGQDRSVFIRQQIEEELQNFDEKRQIERETQAKLKAIESELLTIDGQIKALNIAMGSSKQQVEVLTIQILKRRAELEILTEQIQEIEDKKELQMDYIIDLMTLLQKKDKTFGSEDKVQRTMRLLLSKDAFSENAWQRQQILTAERTARDLFYELEASERELQEIKNLIVRENQELQALYAEKEQEEAQLQLRLSAQAELQRQKERSKEDYEVLLENSRMQMEESVRIIGELQSRRETLEEKMDLLEQSYQQQTTTKRSSTPQTSEDFFEENTDTLTEEDVAIGEDFFADAEGGSKFLAWPVAPRDGISAYYLDGSYEGVFGMKHYAIDIPTVQGTTIKAPSLAYVYKVSDNGMGYSSVILVHRNNLMTVYGHVSKILVSEGDLVQQGDPIALSGGTPGTRGAGLMTTGPHLHFEVFDNGAQQDPLNYLPVSELPLEYIPDRFLQVETGDDPEKLPDELPEEIPAEGELPADEATLPAKDEEEGEPDTDSEDKEQPSIAPEDSEEGLVNEESEELSGEEGPEEGTKFPRDAEETSLEEEGDGVSREEVIPLEEIGTEAARGSRSEDELTEEETTLLDPEVEAFFEEER